MSKIISRAAWGARYRNGFGTRGQAKTVHMHHSVTTSPGPNATFAQDAAAVRTLESIGQSRFGGGISYNRVICESGRIFSGVSWNRIGTHTAGHNTTGMGIVLVGNYSKTRPNKKQLDALVWLIRYEMGEKRITQGARIYGHRDTSSTACPGTYLYAALPDIRKRVYYVAPAPEEDIVSQLPRIDLSKVTSRSTTWVRGSQIQTLQGLLVARGYAPANTIRGDKVDGIAGPGTRAAVVRFQKAVGFTGGAVVGPKTWAKLLRIT